MYSITTKKTMKAQVYVSIFFIILGLNICDVKAQWKFMSPKPSPNSYFSSFFKNSNNIFLGGQAGTITKSTDAGFNWEYVKSPINQIVYAINFPIESTGYAAGGFFYPEMVKTTDEGTTWNTIALPTNSGIIERLDFLNENIGFIHTSNQIFYTTNGTQNFSEINTPVGFIKYSKFEDENNGVLITNSFVVFKTTDRGKNWNQTSNQSINNIEDIYFVNVNTGYVLTEFVLYKTTNGGQNFLVNKQFTSGVSSGGVKLKVNSEMDIMVYRSTWDSSRVYKTTDAGTSWNYLAFTDFKMAITFNFLDNTLLAGMSDGRFFISYNSGHSWENQLDQSVIPKRTIVLDSLNIWSVGSEKVNKSTDGGISWFSYNFPNYILTETISFINPSTGYVAGLLNVNPPAYERHFIKTTNAGATWNYINMVPSSLIFQRYLKFFDENTGIIVSENRIYKTTNGAVNWFLVDNGQDIGGNISFINNVTGFMCNVYASVYKTTNQGSNWTQIAFLPENSFNGISFIDENTGYISALTGTIYKTTNSGVNWTLLDSNSNVRYTSINFKNDAFGLATTQNGIIKVTSTGGNQWIDYSRFISSISTSSSVDIQFIGENQTYISGLGFIYFNKDFTTKLTTQENQVVTNFLLHQNYPNPFNPVTKINFSIPTTQFTVLKVYNSLGQVISTLVNEQLQPGSYEYTFDGSGLASGVYFYRLEAGEFLEAKRMLLIK